MTDFLSADALMSHVRVLARDIGPRPAGHPQEARARDYIRRRLAEVGITEVSAMTFPSPDTWGYATAIPGLLALAGNVLGGKCRAGKLLGGLAALTGAYSLWRAVGCNRQPLLFLTPCGQSGNLVARLSPSGEVRRKLVLVGHTDSNKDRPSFEPSSKHSLLPMATSAILLVLVNGLAQLFQAAGGGRVAEQVRRASMWGMAAAMLVDLADEWGGFVEGANDNASAVACLLGLGAQLSQKPLSHTEVWLAFTGAEEVGCLGMHRLLDVYGQELADAWFIDLEMVGAGEIAYVTRHSSISYLSAYSPDDESLALAEETSRRHPELGVRGRQVVIAEEVGSLRGRGYRGICLVGVGEDGWLVNWHRYSDNVSNIKPASLERAARFVWEMMQTLDENW